MFINERYENYRYLVEASDNYVVLTNSSSVNGTWENPDTINVIYQYIKPSILTIKSELTYTNSKTFTRVDVSTDYWDRGDCCELVLAGFTMLFFILFIINALTRLVRKGGVFFGS